MSLLQRKVGKPKPPPAHRPVAGMVAGDTKTESRPHKSVRRPQCAMSVWWVEFVRCGGGNILGYIFQLSSHKYLYLGFHIPYLNLGFQNSMNILNNGPARF